MPAKHATRLFGPARLVLSFAVAILVLLVVWVAVRAVGPAEAFRQPSVVLPSMPRVPLAPAAVPASTPASPVGSTSATPSPTPSSVAPTTSPAPSRSPSRTSPAARRTTRPAPAATTSPTPRTELAVTLTVGASWEQGYVAAVRVTNQGKAPAAWRVNVSHRDSADIRLQGVWNGSGSQSGDTLVFTGAALAPGKSATFGYQAARDGRGDARPTGCSAVGGTCHMR